MCGPWEQVGADTIQRVKKAVYDTQEDARSSMDMQIPCEGLPSEIKAAVQFYGLCPDMFIQPL